MSKPIALAVPCLLAGCFACASTAYAEHGIWDIGSKTLGGRMLFSDEVVYHDWRVQRSGVTGHYRLIDPDNHRYTFGSREHCLAALEEVKVEKQLPPLPREVVIVVHGLGAGRGTMGELSGYLQQQGRLSVVNVGYASTLGGTAEHAASLVSVIQHLHGVKRVHFVAHSMGNLVVRHALHDLATLPPAQQPGVAWGRFVMIAPPNHGAVAADRFAGNLLVQMVGGDAIEELAPGKGWPQLEPRLATPGFEFGILVGGKGDGEGYLSAIPGDDDMLLSVETSKLIGATDFAQTPGIHQTLPQDDKVKEFTLRYLQTGAFRASGVRYPLVPLAPVQPL